jgi:hypothetical protein
MTTSVAKAMQTEQMMKLFDSHVKLGIQKKKSLLKRLKTQVKVTVERNIYKGPPSKKKKKDGTVKKENVKKEVKTKTKKPIQKVIKETKAVKARTKKPKMQKVKKEPKAAVAKKKTKMTEKQLEVDEDDVSECHVSDVPPSDDTMGGDDDDSDMERTTSESGGGSDKPQEPTVPYHIIAEGKMAWEGQQNIKAYRMVWKDPETLEPMSDSEATWEPASRLENDLTDEYARLVTEFEENATKMAKGRRKRMTERQMKRKKMK